MQNFSRVQIFQQNSTANFLSRSQKQKKTFAKSINLKTCLQPAPLDCQRSGKKKLLGSVFFIKFSVTLLEFHFTSPPPFVVAANCTNGANCVHCETANLATRAVQQVTDRNIKKWIWLKPGVVPPVRGAGVLTLTALTQTLTQPYSQTISPLPALLWTPFWTFFEPHCIFFNVQSPNHSVKNKPNKLASELTPNVPPGVKTPNDTFVFCERCFLIYIILIWKCAAIWGKNHQKKVGRHGSTFVHQWIKLFLHIDEFHLVPVWPQCLIICRQFLLNQISLNCVGWNRTMGGNRFRIFCPNW